ncbi:hypothetical protein [Gorillibacterium sp. sgz5001074]|uniref:hypothetical protein n=1 Tax=Gorillibacterium sp. sgz5001074 TaxID=3446695 RepID=UPI003F66A6CA
MMSLIWNRLPSKVLVCWMAAAILLPVLMLPASAWAASAAEFSPALRTAYDKAVTGASASVAGELRAQDERLQSLREQDRQLDGDIAAIHTANAELLLSIQEKGKVIHAAKLAGLQKEAEEVEARYKQLYNLQGSLSKQAAAAKKLKNKELNSALSFQLDTVKAAVVIARQSRDGKKEQLSDAKADRTKKSKELRAKLVEADKLKVRIQSAKSASVQTGKQITSGLSVLSSAAKKGDAGRTLAAASSLATYSAKLVDQKTAVYDHEQKLQAMLKQIESWVTAD